MSKTSGSGKLLTTLRGLQKDLRIAKGSSRTNIQSAIAKLKKRIK